MSEVEPLDFKRKGIFALNSDGSVKYWFENVETLIEFFRWFDKREK